MWPDPPHVCFANLSSTPSDIAHFEQIYGPISGELDESDGGRLGRSELSVEQEFRETTAGTSRVLLERRRQVKRLTDPAWQTQIASSRRELSADALAQVRIRQEILRRAWHRDNTALQQMGIGLSGARNAEPTYGAIRIHPLVTPTGIDLYAGDMWSFIRVAFMRDFFLGRTRICANNAYECPSPYFLETRKGQTFCCHKCAVQMNVRRFRERESKERK